MSKNNLRYLFYEFSGEVKDILERYKAETRVDLSITPDKICAGLDTVRLNSAEDGLSMQCSRFFFKGAVICNAETFNAYRTWILSFGPCDKMLLNKLQAFYSSKPRIGDYDERFLKGMI